MPKFSLGKVVATPGALAASKRLKTAFGRISKGIAMEIGMRSTQKTQQKMSYHYETDSSYFLPTRSLAVSISG
jgi:hypothetical protein